jgi:hypothetical protein
VGDRRARDHDQAKWIDQSGQANQQAAPKRIRQSGLRPGAEIAASDQQEQRQAEHQVRCGEQQDEGVQLGVEIVGELGWRGAEGRQQRVQQDAEPGLNTTRTSARRRWVTVGRIVAASR